MKLHFLVLLAIALTLGSCTKKQTVATPTPTPSKPEALTPQNITYKAFQLLAHNPSNVNFSPLVFKNSLSTLHADFSAVNKTKLEKLVGTFNEGKKSSQYTLANSIWTKDKKHNLSSKEMNEWISKNSCGTYSDAYDKLDPKNSTIFLSAICFQGKFSSPFKAEDTILTHFQSSPHESSTVKVMHRTGSYPYFEDDSSEWVEIGFKDSSLVLWLGLPKTKFALSAIENAMNSDYLTVIEKGMKKSKVEVVLPKFKLNQKFSLKDFLALIGIEFAFKTTKHSFTEVSQIANFNVDELGINVGSDSSIGNEKEESGFSLRTKKFYATQPFIAIIKDSATNEIITMARVYKP